MQCVVIICCHGVERSKAFQSESAEAQESEFPSVAAVPGSQPTCIPAYRVPIRETRLIPQASQHLPFGLFCSKALIFGIQTSHRFLGDSRDWLVAEINFVSLR